MDADFLPYVGTKIIKARPKENGEGYDGYEVIYEDDYVSWSPKNVFERCYRLITDSEQDLIL